jgi:hypothetical protein
VQQRTGHDRLLVRLREEPAEADRVGQAAVRDTGGQRPRRRATPHHIDDDSAAGQSLRDGQDQFGPLVRDQAAHPDQGRRHRGRLRPGDRRPCCWDGRPIRDQVDVTGPVQPGTHRGDRGGRDRHAGVAPVGPPRGRPFQRPAHPRDPARKVHGKLREMHMMHDAKHRYPPGQHARREERDPVLAVQHRVEGPAVRQQPAEHQRVHGEAAAQPDDLNPVAAVAAALPGRAGGQEADPGPPGDQAAGDVPRVPLGATGLRMPRVTPVGDGDPGASHIREQRLRGAPVTRTQARRDHAVMTAAGSASRPAVTSTGNTGASTGARRSAA